MRHRIAGRKFGRSAAHRQAMTRNQVTALLRHGRITTTEAKAKELRRWVERVITDAKPDDVQAPDADIGIEAAPLGQITDCPISPPRLVAKE